MFRRLPLVVKTENSEMKSECVNRKSISGSIRGMAFSRLSSYPSACLELGEQYFRKVCARTKNKSEDWGKDENA